MPIKTLVLVFLLLNFTSSRGQGNTINDVAKKHLNHLQGCWKRLDTSNAAAYEEWWLLNERALAGRGFVVKNHDTVLLEKLQLTWKDDQFVYVADVPHNQSPVSFVATLVSDDEIVWENSQHDFPKKIRYFFAGDKLLVTVSAGNKAINFAFKKLQ